jgi:hypothetical protein
LALLGDARVSENQNHDAVAAGYAVHLSGDGFFDVGFAVARAFDVIDVWLVSAGWWIHSHGSKGFAVLSSHAIAVGVLQESWFAEAANNAVPGADWAGMWVVAGGWAGGAASAELLI